MGELAERLTLLRAELGYTQSAFSKLIGMPVSSYWHYEKGRVPINTKRLAPIVRNFNVNKKWLFEGKGEMFKASINKDENKEEQTELILELPLQEEEKYMLNGRELGLLLSLPDMEKNKREKVISHFRSYLEIQKMIK